MKIYEELQGIFENLQQSKPRPSSDNRYMDCSALPHLPGNGVEKESLGKDNYCPSHVFRVFDSRTRLIPYTTELL